MHKWVAGWHTPEVQSEFTLHLAPTPPGTCANAVPLPLVIAPITQIPDMTVVMHNRHSRQAMPADEIVVSTP